MLPTIPSYLDACLRSSRSDSEDVVLLFASEMVLCASNTWSSFCSSCTSRALSEDFCFEEQKSKSHSTSLSMVDLVFETLSHAISHTSSPQWTAEQLHKLWCSVICLPVCIVRSGLCALLPQYIHIVFPLNFVVL